MECDSVGDFNVKLELMRSSQHFRLKAALHLSIAGRWCVLRALTALNRDVPRGVDSNLDDAAANSQHFDNDITDQNFFI